MNEWFETLDDRFWLKPDEIGEDEARFIKLALGLRRGQSVLDAPCGAGRIAFHLARFGLSVTGIDLRRTFIERARRRFRRAGLASTLLVMDMRAMDFKDRYHGIYNWFGSFGYFSDAGNEQLVRAYARALRSGGRLILEQTNRERVLRHFIPIRRETNFTIRNRWDKRTERLISMRTFHGRRKSGNLSSMRLYTPVQMRDLLARNGLVMEHLYGSPDRQPFTASSGRMIVIAQKR